MDINTVRECVEKYLGFYDLSVKSLICEKIVNATDKYELVKALCNKRVFEDEFYDTKYEEMNDYIDAILMKKVKSNQFNGRKIRLFTDITKIKN